MPPQATVGREKVDWEKAYADHGPMLLKVEAAISEQETRNALTLTPDAVEALLLPFLIELERLNTIPEHVITSTMQKTFAQLKTSPDSRDKDQTRSVFSVIRAWWKAWCDVPPICKATDE